MVSSKSTLAEKRLESVLCSLVCNKVVLFEMRSPNTISHSLQNHLHAPLPQPKYQSSALTIKSMVAWIVAKICGYYGWIRRGLVIL